MQNITFIAVCALLFCTAMQARATQFMEQSRKVEKECSQNLKRISFVQWLELDVNTGYSPLTESAICYRDRIKVVASETKYKHAILVNNFAETVVKIATARDVGKINSGTALSLYRNLSSEFRTFIATEDAEDQLRESERIAHGINGVMRRLQA
jgi:hypothetical protein